MNVAWSILYRGPLSSCNYECDYCPFAKTRNTREELQEDARQLRRFTGWVGGRREEIGILFTPWGEALPHEAYQDALCELSHLPNVRHVAIQTNLSCQLNWLKRADSAKLALWCTFHPTQVTLARFLQQTQLLDAAGVRYSVGVVGTKKAMPFLAPLRQALRSEVYLWINAFKRLPDYYSPAEIESLAAIDPVFPVNNLRHPSLGKACRTGHTVFSVDGSGDIRRCHFVKTKLGNIYEPGFENALYPRTCPAESCGCHIGYVHMEHLRMEQLFGYGLLARIPERPLNQVALAESLAACVADGAASPG